MSSSPFDRTARLADRVLDGEVVFFIGSGFSIDSEGNSASRLVGRLLAGLLAMGTSLEDDARNRNQASALLDGLGQVFGLAGAKRPGAAARQPALCMTNANLALLAREYYNFNDWAVSALGVLSDELLDRPEPQRSRLARRIERLGTFLLTLVGDKVPLDPIECDALHSFGTDAAARGKALFLDIMGFANSSIMAGTPYESNVERVASSYQARLRPRHHALARLAREGLAAALVTTNYDLLLEGAYRLAGFVERENADPAPDGIPADRVPRFSRIAGANQFFTSGTGYRTALLLKIHGCAQAYRNARSEQIKSLMDATSTGPEAQPLAQKPNPWSGYLPALVFTYREIQTWRADAWSRDLIRTLLRTHTLALCGYSGADPVMHSTFREVYDEQSALYGTAPPQRKSESAEKASVFFFGIAGRREFHSLEILRAATLAGGFCDAALLNHPNHIEFEHVGGFPALDDHFRWLMHCVMRRLQANAVKGHLRRLAPRLLGRQCRDKELEAIIQRFAKLLKAEHEAVVTVAKAGEGVPPATRRREFGAVVGWTWHFVPGLLRELALADLVGRYQGGGRAFQAKRTWAYYHPASEYPERTAWTVIVELALRTLVAALPPVRHRRLAIGDLAIDDLVIGDAVAEESPYAAISFDTGDHWPQPAALCIHVKGLERPRVPEVTGVFRHITHWELGPQDAPWPMSPSGFCPRPKDMWDWALAKTRVNPSTAARHLKGVP
jgi:hypothetical protein